MFVRFSLASLLAGFVVAGAPWGSLRAAAGAAKAFEDFKCTECHDRDTKKGDLDLTALEWKMEDRGNFDEWVKIYDRVAKGEMPPAKKARLEPKAEADFLAKLKLGLARYCQEQEKTQGRTVLRRLNRDEYERTVQDLLAIQTPLKGMLPEDAAVDGFDTVAEGLRFSTLQMEKYLEAADHALDAAAVLTQQPETKKTRNSLKEDKEIRKSLDTPEGTITDKNSKNKHRHTLKELPDAVVFFSDGYPPAQFRDLRAPVDGLYRVRISAYAYQTKGAPVYMRVYGDNYAEKRLLGWYDLPADHPREVEFTAKLLAGEHLLVLAMDVGYDEKGQGVYNVGADNYTGRGMAMQWAELEGPLVDSWPPKSTKLLLGEAMLKEVDPKKAKYRNGKKEGYELAPTDPHAALVERITGFAARAFRRPLEKGEADAFIKLATDAQAAGADFETSLRAGLRGVLTAPQFLFFTEQPGKLDDWALASRLSYFLWSTMPDEALLKVASEGKLHEPAMMKAQVERMLKDAKAAAFVENFTGQWLDLRNIEATTPDMRLYPEFDELLKVAMVDETRGFFAEILNKNLSISNFIQSDFAMLNRRLAEHYGIPGVNGEELRRVALPTDSPRGGLLTQASILKVTANGTVSSPVLRGSWVLKRLLGQPPAPPPANVGSIEPDTRGATTVREQLAKHRNLAVCASCHMKIDPPGFAMESFDVIGGWRDRYRSLGNGDRVQAVFRGRNAQYKAGPKVDASGEMPDGRKFAGIAEFKQLLLAQQDQVTRALAAKLLTYATGAGVSFADRDVVELMAQRTREQGGGLRTLVQEVVASSVFQMK